MNRLAALLTLSLCCPPAQAAPGVGRGEVWNELFAAREQRVLSAINADPAANREFWSGLQAVVDKQQDADKFEQAKRRFQIRWFERIKDFSGQYRRSDAALRQKMAGLAKPDSKAVGQDKLLQWFADYDRDVWAGQLVPAIWKHADPYHLAYNISSMRAMNKAQRDSLIARFDKGKDHWLKPSAETVAEIAVEESRKEFVKELTQAESEIVARFRSVKEQLAAIDLKLGAAASIIAKGPQAGSDEALAEKGADFDGALPSKDNGSAVVDARPDSAEQAAAGAAVADDKPNSGLQRSAETAPAAEQGVHFGEPPAPKTDESQNLAAAEEPGFGSKLRAAWKSPKVKAGAGALLGGILGFIFGGPIGALIGAAAGAAAMYGASKLL
ncbi:MAG: hypothetical protein ABIJ96_00690 [Elusimicrobiota bacterium]